MINDDTISENPARKQLHDLASYLEDRREIILKTWRTETRRAPGLTVAATLTRQQFNDHIPGVLDALSDRLRAWPLPETPHEQNEEEKQVTEHGVQRWRQGYQLHELTQEWGQLQMCLMEELETYSANHADLEPEVMRSARRALAHLCWDGICDSTREYWRLHQAEASGRVRELEQALNTLQELDRVRAAAWHEAAHDLRGSVTLVSGAATVLGNDNIPEPWRQQSTGMLQNGISSLQDMLNDLMSLARLAAGHEERVIAPFDAGELMTEFCSTSKPLAEQQGLFLKMVGPASLPVEGDRAKVQRILQNLLLNALKYTKSGGVTVRWGPRDDNGYPGGWTFCVQDTGPGLDTSSHGPAGRGQLPVAASSAHSDGDADQSEAVVDFTSRAPTDPSQRGTLPAGQLPSEGIGLSIVKRLCELIDARIELESSPGKGSNFCVKLPDCYS